MKTLLTTIPHMPSFDSCFPLIERLHQRGKVRLRNLLGSRIRKTEPRVVEAFERSGVPYEKVGLIRMELLAGRAVRKADAVLTHSDPIAYGGKLRPRDKPVLDGNVPMLFVQHGLIQWGLTYAREKHDWKFHASKMLVWEAVSPNMRSSYQEDYFKRMETVGLIKTNKLGQREPSAELSEILGKYSQRVMICHNYGHEGGNFFEHQRKGAFRCWEEVFKARPDTLFILRSHRGRKFKAHQGELAALVSKFPNVIFSDRYDALTRFATIHDMLDLIDLVVTHPSTVVTDALYAGKPVALLDNEWERFSCLHDVNNPTDFLAYLDEADPLARAGPVFERYGEIGANLDRAAAAAEDWLATL